MSKRDLVDLMLQTAEKLQSEIEKERRLDLEKELADMALDVADALSVLRELKPRNGTEYDRVRTTRERLARRLDRRRTA
jgi:hypothetical protein